MKNDPLATDNEQFFNPTKKPVVIKRRPKWVTAKTETVVMKIGSLLTLPTWVTAKILDDWLMNDSDHLPDNFKSEVVLSVAEAREVMESLEWVVDPEETKNFDDADNEMYKHYRSAYYSIYKQLADHFPADLHD